MLLLCLKQKKITTAFCIHPANAAVILQLVLLTLSVVSPLSSERFLLRSPETRYPLTLPPASLLFFAPLFSRLVLHPPSELPAVASGSEPLRLPSDPFFILIRIPGFPFLFDQLKYSRDGPVFQEFFENYLNSHLLSFKDFSSCSFFLYLFSRTCVKMSEQVPLAQLGERLGHNQ